MSDDRDKIRRAVAVSGISKALLARRSGLSINTLAGIERSNWDPNYSTVMALLTAVDTIKRERA